MVRTLGALAGAYLWLWVVVVVDIPFSSGCRTLIDTCGSICMCHDVLLRTDDQLNQGCNICMPANNRGCFCPRGQAWSDLSRNTCVTFDECRRMSGGGGGGGGGSGGGSDGDGEESRGHDPAYYSYIPGAYGPSNWDRNFPVCAGSGQSPISFPDRTQVSVDNGLPDLDLAQYDQYLLGFSFSNTGHSAKVTCPKTPEVFIRNGFGVKYRLVQFHFHWGRNEFEGSEHLFDDRAFPVEAHFVHELVEGQPGAQSARKYLVVGVMFQVGDQPNDAMEMVLRNIAEISQPDAKVAMDYPVNLNDFLPADRSSFYHYNGSFTTPGCDEVVAWYVLMKPLKMSRAQRAILSNALFTHKPKVSKPSESAHRHHENDGHDHDEDLPVITHNFRPVQPINDRLVVAKFAPGAVSEVRQPTAKEFIPVRDTKNGQDVKLQRGYGGYGGGY